MKKLLERWGNYLSEGTTHFEVDVRLRYERTFALYGPVFNKIRAINGITIAKAEEDGVIDIQPNQKEVVMHLKFIPDRPLKEYGAYLKNALLKIKDEDEDRIINVKFIKFPHPIKRRS
tara:strand:- start:107 stop:460 length:354 start_codon:yes stop_codon:yes gene_type:complete